jgi:hypothetical protein
MKLKINRNMLKEQIVMMKERANEENLHNS